MGPEALETRGRGVGPEEGRGGIRLTGKMPRRRTHKSWWNLNLVKQEVGVRPFAGREYSKHRQVGPEALGTRGRGGGGGEEERGRMGLRGER